MVFSVGAINTVVKQYYTPSDQVKIVNPELVRYVNIQNGKNNNNK